MVMNAGILGFVTGSCLFQYIRLYVLETGWQRRTNIVHAFSHSYLLTGFQQLHVLKCKGSSEADWDHVSKMNVFPICCCLA